jgi:hypothetical protein
VRYLGEIGHREDLATIHTETVQFALARGQQFHDARRAVAQIPPPPGYDAMRQALDGWLGGLQASSETIIRAQPPIRRETLDRAQKILRDAASRADRFNHQRTTAVQTLVDAQSPVPARAKKMVASKKEMRALAMALIAALLLAGGAAFGLSTLASAPPPTRVPTPAAKPGGQRAGLDRRVFTQPEILQRLKAEIAARKVIFFEPDVRLVAPDRIIITGKVQGPAGLVPVEAEIQAGATPDGKPRVDSKRLSAVGVEVPPGAFDALTKRVEEANKVLPDQVSPGQFVRRIFVENNTLVVELDGGTPGQAPAPAPGANATPAAKPGA